MLALDQCVTKAEILVNVAICDTTPAGEASIKVLQSP